MITCMKAKDRNMKKMNFKDKEIFFKSARAEFK